MPRRLAAVLPLVALLALAAPAAARAADPATYVRGAQNADGGFGMTQSGGSQQFATGWAMLGLAASGHAPGAAALAYVRSGLGSLGAIGDKERTVLAVHAAGGNPRSFGGRDLIRDVLKFRRSDGSFGGYVSYTSFAIFALRAGGVARSATSVREALSWLGRQQNPDGGFNVAGHGGPSGGDDTGYALQALVRAGGSGTARVRRAAAYLVSVQHSDGGFGLQAGGASNAQSTAFVVQGLVAAHGSAAAITRGLRYLRSLIEANGLTRYSRTSRQTPVWVTSQVLMALARRPF